MNQPYTPVIVPSHLPQMAADTTAESPWPLRLLSAKIGEYISKMSRMWVEGEVTSIKRRPNAKVQYFQLADLEARPQITITVKMWSHALPPSIVEGTKVVALTKPDFWQGNGSFTLFADEIREKGVGDILARIEALKAKLAAEGLFAASHKKELPFLPRKIGLIVGRNTEAEKDVVVNARLRWPNVHFAIKQVQVQGAGSIPAMIAALSELDTAEDIAVIVFARGGGSPEDLLPFSDEALVRAAFAARTPIVSAIGHEADSPLLDLVADVRASTPTDAARKIVPDMGEQREKLRADLHRGRTAMARIVNTRINDISALRARPALAYPERMLDARAQELANAQAWGRSYIHTALHTELTNVRSSLAQLRTLSPLSTLNRGYSILRDENGTLVSSIDETSSGAHLEVLMRDGQLTVEVHDLHKQSTDRIKAL